MEFNSIPFIFFINSIHFLHDSFTSLSSHPLFSTIITLHTLILIFTPSLFITIAFSPLLNSTGILLLFLLRLGANKTSEKESSRSDSRILESDDNKKSEIESSSPNFDYYRPKWLPTEEGLFAESDSVESGFLDFVKWNHIYTEFEPKTDLASDSNQTHVQFKPKLDIGSKTNDLCNEFKQSVPKTDLGSETYEIQMDFESKTDIDSKSDQTLVEFVSKTHVTKSNLNTKPEIGLGSECDQAHIESEPKAGAGSETATEADDHKWELLETISMEPPQTTEEDPRTKTGSEPADTSGSGHWSGSTQFYKDPFLEWNIGAPLEIIYEAYEGEEDEKEEEGNENDDVSGDKRDVGPVRYPSLSMYYPESETDSSSDGELPVIGNWETPENLFFKWEEDERDELIEISLDRYGKKNVDFCRFEEDNLIEIDISPAGS